MWAMGLGTLVSLAAFFALRDRLEAEYWFWRLKAGDESEARTAANLLSEVGSPSMVPRLLAYLAQEANPPIDPKGRRRGRVQEAIESLHAREARKVGFLLEEALGDPRPRVRDAAFESIVRIGPRCATQGVLERVRTRLDDPEPKVRAEAAKAFHVLQTVPPSAVPPLLRNLSDADEEVRLSSADCLGLMQVRDVRAAIASLEASIQGGSEAAKYDALAAFPAVFEAYRKEAECLWDDGDARGTEALLLEIVDRTDSLMWTHRVPLPFSPHWHIACLRRIRGDMSGELEILGRYLDWQIKPFLPELPEILERTVELAGQFPEDAFARAVGKKARRVSALSEMESICDMAETASWDAEREWPRRIQDLAQATDEDGAPPFSADFERIGKDPWGNPYLFAVKDDELHLTSLGSDGREGGEGEAADLTWPPEDPARGASEEAAGGTDAPQ